MTDHEVTAKLEQLAQDKAFINEFLSCETPEAAQAALKEKGVELSLEQVTALGEAIAADPSGELSEEQLTNVSGGLIGTALAISGGLYTFYKGCQASYHLGYQGAKAAHSVYKWFKKW